MAELLVHPFKQGPAEPGDMFGLLSTYPNLEWIAPDLETAAHAAKIRAQHRLRTPDAIQAATALSAKATALLTNDRIFKRITDLDVLVLDDYV